jgi:hypothetical protein
VIPIVPPNGDAKSIRPLLSPLTIKLECATKSPSGFWERDTKALLGANDDVSSISHTPWQVQQASGFQFLQRSYQSRPERVVAPYPLKQRPLNEHVRQAAQVHEILAENRVAGMTLENFISLLIGLPFDVDR